MVQYRGGDYTGGEYQEVPYHNSLRTEGLSFISQNEPPVFFSEKLAPFMLLPELLLAWQAKQPNFQLFFFNFALVYKNAHSESCVI